MTEKSGTRSVKEGGGKVGIRDLLSVETYLHDLQPFLELVHVPRSWLGGTIFVSSIVKAGQI
jgi:hypothetical protein